MSAHDISKLLERFTLGPDGRIRNRGKFEMTPIYTPFFHEAALDAFSPRGRRDVIVDDTHYTFFVLTPKDKATFPDLASEYGVVTWETEAGFVYCVSYHDEASFEREIAGLEDEA